MEHMHLSFLSCVQNVWYLAACRTMNYVYITPYESILPVQH